MDEIIENWKGIRIIMFKVMVIGYGLNPIKLFETDSEKEASDCCEKNNSKILASGVPAEALCIHPQYQYYRRVRQNI